MQQEYSILYKDFLSSKSKVSGESFSNINKLQICCYHHRMLNTIADADLEDHEGRSTQDNSSTITRTILDVETCMMSSKFCTPPTRLNEEQTIKVWSNQIGGLYPMDPIS
ncbi:hypothetical protein O181_113949 [Austropuccinia psidii MF-1]|uniref:Uncharacterized protein n=1 Tax=Austropuccinia psidii MF-1 TaxID=1389203 RepID=A0A9Q3PU64_9BASI|nr:hypothetical protein [Austropuccinia psidii MF-1]